MEPQNKPEKRPVNLRARSDLLDCAKAMGINLSATLEEALMTEVKKRKAEQWRKDNKKAMEALNQFTEEHGLFSDEFRTF
ncbi:type II toxin-antitoxin system CcdA family antitoxin [Endozoicomonas acroporae]|uniref:type II toxin-antitoxin system CcdA family antitoxin n=1 Tax=Endozoicomonas acroporae TaxID=1701104 RepID=UPI000C788C12|nr:type II toxin-antitoxin system CcdA family antitoxin [Endozoicomonas acroporae]